jgi:hypothetical protein
VEAVTHMLGVWEPALVAGAKANGEVKNGVRNGLSSGVAAAAAAAAAAALADDAVGKVGRSCGCGDCRCCCGCCCLVVTPAFCGEELDFNEESKGFGCDD